MAPSRRRVLELSGLALGGSLGLSVAAGTTDSGSRTDDWPMARHDSAGTGHHPTASGPKDGVRIAWTHDSTEWFRGTTQPILRADTVLAAGRGVLALDRERGARQFGHPGPYRSTPAPVRASIYDTDTLAVTGPSGVYGLNAAGGYDVPLVNYTIGAKRWDGPQSSGGSLVLPEPTIPVAADGSIYTPIPGTNSVAALDPNDGSVRWRRTHREDEAMGVEFNRPAVRDGLVVVTNWPYQATAYRTDSGEQLWQRDLAEQMILPPVATEAGIVVQSRNTVRLLDAAAGSTLWERPLGGNATESTPAVADGTVYAADAQESLHALDLATGEPLWTAPFGGETAPVVADGVVYAVRSGVTLVAIDATSGETRFEYQPPGPPMSTPVVGDGTLYATNRDGIVALEEAA